MPLAVYVLGLSLFCMSTTEVMIAGMLPQLAMDLDVSLSTAGLLISGFALAIVVGGPVLTVALGRVVRKHALLGLLGLFVLGQVLGAAAPTYTVMLISRVVSALALGTFFGIGAAVAVGLAGPGHRARAMALLVGGLTLANVLGTPAATLLAERASWRASFAVVGGISILCLIAVATLVPRQPRPDGMSVRHEVTIYARARLWAALATTATYLGAYMSAFSYYTPLLTGTTRVPAGAVPGMLFLLGAGSVIGTWLAGRLTDRYPFGTALLGVTGLCVALALVGLAAHSLFGMLMATPLLGIGAFAANPTVTARAMRAADDGALAAASNGSAVNIGVATGPWVGGMALDAGWGNLAPVWIGVGIGVLCLLILTLSKIIPGLHPNGPQPTNRPDRDGDCPEFG